MECYKMNEERTKQLMSIAYIITANELGFTTPHLSEDDLAKIIEDNKITLEEMLILDEYVQNFMEFVTDGDD